MKNENKDFTFAMPWLAISVAYCYYTLGPWGIPLGIVACYVLVMPAAFMFSYLCNELDIKLNGPKAKDENSEKTKKSI